MSELLKDRVCVITGGGRGIGQATAILFAKEGGKVLISDIDKAPLDETVSLIKSFGGNAVGIVSDVTKKEDCEMLMKAATEVFHANSIEVLANIAGMTKDKIIHQMTLEEWNFIINLNLTGTFNCIQAASPYMREPAKEEKNAATIKPRSIINISSTSARGNAGQINYAASKAGVEGLTKTVAKEWARFNIRCNAIAPGFIETRLTQPKKDEKDFGIPEEQKKVIDKLQLETGLAREHGKPVDIANAALFFASDLSTFVTGQVLTVAGGMIGSI